MAIAFCLRQGVRGFPTVQGYSNGRLIQYQGGFQAPALQNFVANVARA
jgi:hypothetical protein